MHKIIKFLRSVIVSEKTKFVTFISKNESADMIYKCMKSACAVMLAAVHKLFQKIKGAILKKKAMGYKQKM